VTCSLLSLPPADLALGLHAAVVEVAENSLFAFADQSDQATFDAAAGATGDWICTHIRFTGSTCGTLEVNTPAALVRRLCASFAGASPDDAISESDVVDFAGEFANMVCGTWLTRTCRHESFSLTPPRVIAGSAAIDLGGESGGSSATTLYLAIDDTPIRLVVAWGLGQSPEGRTRGE
jgi:hypothetical protein